MINVAIGLWSILGLVVLVYSGLYVPIVMILVSVIGLRVMRGSLDIAGALLAISATDSIEGYVYGVVPLFVLMGLLVMIADLGKDAFAVARQGLERLPGSPGITTVVANAIFAAITGVSIASATVFTKLAVPEMLRYGYAKRFAVGVVAGSSVLGMLIPPSVLFIIFGLITNASIGDLSLGGIVPGVILATAYTTMIVIRARRDPQAFGAGSEYLVERLSGLQMTSMIVPISILIIVVLGGSTEVSSLLRNQVRSALSGH